MDREEALDFLRQHQPMPPDNQLTKDLIAKYDKVRRYCVTHPDPECIPLFLNSFGEGSGFGVYQLVEDVMRQFPTEMVISHLAKSLQSEHRSVRSWSAEIARLFPSPDLIDVLRDALLNDRDPEVRNWTTIALQVINDERVDTVLEQALQREKDNSVRQDIIDALTERSEKKGGRN